MSEKSQWGSKLGFILASAGSAIGLGAVWKFPYMTAANGGGGFLLVFLISTILIGFPLLLAEFAIAFSSFSSIFIIIIMDEALAVKNKPTNWCRKSYFVLVNPCLVKLSNPSSLTGIIKER